MDVKPVGGDLTVLFRELANTQVSGSITGMAGLTRLAILYLLLCPRKTHTLIQRLPLPVHSREKE